MKKYIIPALAIVAMMASCNKEVTQVEETKNNVEIRAVINNDVDVKTDYNIQGSTAYFHWSGTETIGVMSYNTTISQIVFTSTSSATNETSLVFSGVDDGYGMGYALYPSKKDDGITNNPNTLSWYISSGFWLHLGETVEYNATAPLKDIIPMIGAWDMNSEQFDFTPVTGVIEVSLRNLPTEAREITLSSPGKSLSGFYLLTSNQNKTNIANELQAIRTGGLKTTITANSSPTNKSITFQELDRNEHRFYFPVSVGTLPNGLTITVKDGSGEELQTVSYTKSITTVQGQITRFPTMDLAKATKVSVTGTSRQFFAYLTKLGPEASVKVAVSNTADGAITAARSSSKVISSEGVANKVEVSNELTETGKYYLGYVVYAGETEIRSDSMPVYYLSSDDAATIASQYRQNTSAAYSTGNSPSWNPTALNNDNNNTITVAVSDDPLKGQIMITEFAGLHYNPSTNTNTNSGVVAAWNAEYQSTNFSDGSPVYGEIGTTLGTSTLTAYFYNLSSTTFFRDTKANRNYFISQYYGSNYLRVCFDSTGYTSDGRHGIVLWDTSVRLSHSGSYSYYMLEFTRYVGDKVSE